MASRVIFRPTNIGKTVLFTEELVSFEWVPGMALSQGTKSVLNLHASAIANHNIKKILEISTRSPSIEGVSLSAFNLPVVIDGLTTSVEVAYQASKVFDLGGPYIDLLRGSSLQAKTDIRLKTSGKMIGFSSEGTDWPLSESPNFYDYLYIKGLLRSSLKSHLEAFEAFSDIAYNQNTHVKKSKKSFNCQARSAAIYISLTRRMNEGEILRFLKKEALRKTQGVEQIELF